MIVVLISDVILGFLPVLVDQHGQCYITTLNMMVIVIVIIFS